MDDMPFDSSHLIYLFGIPSRFIVSLKRTIISRGIILLPWVTDVCDRVISHLATTLIKGSTFATAINSDIQNFYFPI